MNFFQKFKNATLPFLSLRKASSNNRIFIKNGRYLIFSLIFVVSACGSGCIDPEDYGAYDTEIVTVDASGILSSGCDWSMIEDTPTLDENNNLGNMLSSASASDQFLENLGCIDYDGLKYDAPTFSNENKMSCFNEAKIICQVREQLQPSLSNSPWERTTLKTVASTSGLNLKRDTKIFIKAAGDISFGGDANPIIAFFGDGYRYGSAIGHQYIQKNDVLSASAYDFSAGDDTIFMVSGQINTSSGSPTSLSTGWEEDAHIGFSRLYAYIQEFPTNYIASSGATENERAIGDYPIDPDPRLWKCFSSGDGNNWGGGIYSAFKNDGTPFNMNDLVTNCYAENYNKIGFYENLKRRSIDTSTGIVENIDQALISKIKNADSDSGNLAIYAEKYNTSDYDITHPNPKNLGKYGGAILNNSDGIYENGGVLSGTDYSYFSDAGDIALDPNKYRLVKYSGDDCSVTFANSDYSVSNEIILPPNQSAAVSGTDCTINIRDIKHVILERSGYVRFFYPEPLTPQTSAKSCNLKIAIINQDTSGGVIREKFNTDFVKDVPVKQVENTNSIGEFLSVFDDPIYLRKGQVLLFLPNSWKWSKGTWSEGNCDINTLMHIEYRPAVFCKNVGSINEESHVAANMNNCVHAINEDDSRICSGNDDKSATIDSNYKCFDATDYRDKLSDLGENLDDLSSLPLGINEVEFFNGISGNFTGKYNSSSVDNYLTLTESRNDYGMYKLSTTSLIPFPKSGRIKFLFLDDETHVSSNISSGEFFDSHADTAYSGSNGFQIDFRPFSSFSNGKSLQIVLCDNTDSNCNSTSSFEKIIIKDDKNYGNNYDFTKSGTLKNISSSSYKDYYMHEGRGEDSNDDELYLAFNIYNPNQQYSSDNNCFTDETDPNKNSKDCNSDSSCANDEDVNTPPCCNGKLINNPYYEDTYCEADKVEIDNKCCPYNDIEDDLNCKEGSASDKSTTVINSFCQQLSPVCKNHKICSGSNFGNSGSYKVTVKVSTDDGADTRGIVSGIISPILNFLDGTETKSGYVERVYVNTVHNDLFIKLVQLLSILLVTFYGVGYFIGTSDMKQKDLMGMVLKIAIIYLLISPDSWYWYKTFFVDTTKGGIDYITFLMSSTFDRDPEILSAISNNDFSDKWILFKSSDRMFKMLFEDTIHKKILGIIFNNYFGIVYVIFIYWAIIKYLQAFFVSISFFIIAQSLTSILLLYGPIFIILTFFKAGAGFFKNWYEQLLGLALQQVLIILFLSFFNGIIYELFRLNFNYRVCWGTVWSVPIVGIGPIFEFWSLPSTGTGMSPSDPSLISGVPHLVAIIFIYFMCKMMYDFIEVATKVSNTIVGNIAIQKGSNGYASQMVNNAMKSAKMTAISAGRSISKRTGIGERFEKRKDAVLDKYFDYGKTADERHKNQKKENTKNKSQKLALRSAGDDADKKYLKDHNIHNRKLKPEEKLEMQKGRDEAIKNKAKELGIDLSTDEGKKQFKKLTETRGDQFMSEKERDDDAKNQVKEMGMDVDSKEGKREVNRLKDNMRNRDDNMPLKAGFNLLQATKGHKADGYFLSSRTAQESKYYDRQDEKVDTSKRDVDPTLAQGGPAVSETPPDKCVQEVSETPPPLPPPADKEPLIRETSQEERGGVNTDNPVDGGEVEKDPSRGVPKSFGPK
ncbi:MAG: type IV secretory pathway VirB6-like protein [Rickettsiales bacterium]|jgi:type IV secretory pathway VirB6-like protein